MSDAPSNPLPLASAPWQIKLRSTGKSSSSGRIEADAESRTELARALGILSCDRLVVDYRLKSAGRDRFNVSGRLEADLVQACVATLEPVPETVREDFSTAFWPAEELDADLPKGEIHLDEETPEPIEHGEIALGRLVYELIAVAMEPFPRSPNAPAAGETPPVSSGPKPENPFAALAKLKKPG